MSVNSKVVIDRTLECMVCGKLFPRGMKDLSRHSTASTLMHQVSSIKTDIFAYGCKKCSNWFTCSAHLDLHQKYTTCDKNKNGHRGTIMPPKAVPKAKVVQSDDSDDEFVYNYEPRGGNPKQTDENKTMECMVCGKLFPRGPIDLQRHSIAITLRHYVANTETRTCYLECDKCNLFFSSEEHLDSHKELSTCNPNMVWPRNAHTTSGTRTITKKSFEEGVPEPADIVEIKAKTNKRTYTDEQLAETYTTADSASESEDSRPRALYDLPTTEEMEAKTLAALTSNEPVASGLRERRMNTIENYFTKKSNNGNNSGYNSNSSISSNNGTVNLASFSSMPAPTSVTKSKPPSGLPPTGLTPNSTPTVITKKAPASVGIAALVASSPAIIEGKRVRIPTNLAIPNYITEKNVPTPQSTSKSSASGDYINGSASKSHKKREMTIAENAVASGISLKIIKTKKMKHMVPEERKAFFAVVSMLIGSCDSEERMSVRITEENYEEYIPEQHKALVTRLQGLLHYTI